MESLKHSPGPWAAMNQHFDPHRREHYPIYNDAGVHIADVVDTLDGGYDEEKGEPVSNPANAQLIAASPELLEVCKAAVRILRHRLIVASPWGNALVGDLERAITLAEGQS